MISRGEKEENVSYTNHFYPLFEKENIDILYAHDKDYRTWKDTKEERELEEKAE